MKHHLLLLMLIVHTPIFKYFGRIFQLKIIIIIIGYKTHKIPKKQHSIRYYEFFREYLFNQVYLTKSTKVKKGTVNLLVK